MIDPRVSKEDQYYQTWHFDNDDKQLGGTGYPTRYDASDSSGPFGGGHIHELIICVAVLTALGVTALYIVYFCIRRHCCQPRKPQRGTLNGIDTVVSQTTSPSGRSLHTAQPAVNGSMSPYETIRSMQALGRKSPKKRPRSRSPPPPQLQTAPSRRAKPIVATVIMRRRPLTQRLASPSRLNAKTTVAAVKTVRKSPRRRGPAGPRAPLSNYQSAHTAPQSTSSFTGQGGQVTRKSPVCQSPPVSPLSSVRSSARKSPDNGVPSLLSPTQPHEPHQSQLTPASLPSPPPVPENDNNSSQIVHVDVPVITAEIIKQNIKAPPEKEYSLFKSPNFFD